jgi:glycosyltransferase AglE
MTDQLPFVSVIVPVLNDEARIGTCIEALLAQSYPRDRYEIFVVDNGSSDRSYAIAQRYPIAVLRESATRSSFAARNLALPQARGSIHAFTDSDCTPSPHWLAEGVKTIRETGADMVGGNVRFVYSKRPSAAEVYDSIANMQIERNVRERGVCKTANLFATAKVYATIGPFPHSLPSGGDVIWTARATEAGFRIVYNHAAEVAHPTRRLPALLKKHFRVGRGHHAIRVEQRAKAAAGGAGGPSAGSSGGKGGGKLRKLKRALRGFKPEPLSAVRASLRRNNVEGKSSLLRVWFVIWMCRVATTLGNLTAAWQGQVKKRSQGAVSVSQNS